MPIKSEIIGSSGFFVGKIIAIAITIVIAIGRSNLRLQFDSESDAANGYDY